MEATPLSPFGNSRLNNITHLCLFSRIFSQKLVNTKLRIASPSWVRRAEADLKPDPFLTLPSVLTLPSSTRVRSKLNHHLFIRTLLSCQTHSSFTFTAMTTLGPWIIGSPVGKGSFSHVRKAQHSIDGTVAVCKTTTLSTDPTKRLKQRVLLESEIATLVHLDGHPNSTYAF